MKIFGLLPSVFFLVLYSWSRLEALELGQALVHIVVDQAIGQEVPDNFTMALLTRISNISFVDVVKRAVECSETEKGHTLGHAYFILTKHPLQVRCNQTTTADPGNHTAATHWYDHTNMTTTPGTTTRTTTTKTTRTSSTRTTRKAKNWKEWEANEYLASNDEQTGADEPINHLQKKYLATDDAQTGADEPINYLQKNSQRFARAVTEEPVISTTNGTVEDLEPITAKKNMSSWWLFVIGPDYVYTGKHGALPPKRMAPDQVLNRTYELLQAFIDENRKLIDHPPVIVEEVSEGFTAVKQVSMWLMILCFLVFLVVMVITVVLVLKYRDLKTKYKEAQRRIRADGRNKAEQARRSEVKKAQPSPLVAKPSKSESVMAKRSTSTISKKTTTTSGKEKVLPPKEAKGKPPLVHGGHSDDSNSNPKALGTKATSHSVEEKSEGRRSTRHETSQRRQSVERVKEPISTPEFVQIMGRLTEFLATNVSTPSFYDVTSASPPGSLLKVLPARAPEQPQEYELIEADITGLILREISHPQHTRFHGSPSNGRTYTSVIAEMIAAAIGSAEQSDTSGRQQLEMCAVNWYGRALGLPEAFLFQGNIKDSPGGGTLMDNSTAALQAAIIAARHWKLGQLQTALSAIGSPLKDKDFAARLVFYGNRSHVSFETACSSTGLLYRAIQVLAEKDYSLSGEELEEQIKKDLEQGLVPAFVVCSQGSGHTYSADNLKSMADVARKYNLWLHVDAASDGVAWIEPKHRAEANGLDEAMSVCVNGPRALLPHSSPCVYWTRDQRQHCSAFRGIDNRSVFTWSLAKETAFRGLKLWIDLRLNGVNGLRNYVNRLIELTARMEEMVLAGCPRLRKFPQINTSKSTPSRSFRLAFLVEYHETGFSLDEVNRSTRALAAYINSTRQLYVGHRKYDGHDFIVLAVAHEKATLEEVQASVQLLVTLVMEFASKRDELTRALMVDGDTSVDKMVMPAPGGTEKDPKNGHQPITKERIPIEILRQVGLDADALKKVYVEDVSTGKANTPASNVGTPKETSSMTNAVPMPPLPSMTRNLSFQQPPTAQPSLVQPSMAQPASSPTVVPYKGVMIRDESLQSSHVSPITAQPAPATTPTATQLSAMQQQQQPLPPQQQPPPPAGSSASSPKPPANIN